MGLKDWFRSLVGPEPFSRYTDRARTVVAFANEHAKRLNHKSIGTEHLILGFVQEGSGVGAHALKSLNVDMAFISREVEKRTKPGPPQLNVGKLPLAAATQEVVQQAIAEAGILGHDYVGTEHLLLGMLHEKDGVAAEVLRLAGLNIDNTRHAVRRTLGEAVEPDPGPPNLLAACPMCQTLSRINSSPALIAELPSTFAVLSENQGPRGWCVLLLKEHREHLAELEAARQLRVFTDVSRVAAAIRSVFPDSGKDGGPPRINYECLGNLVPHVHWHVIPRHADDLEPTKAVWGWPEAQLRGTMTEAEREQLIGRLRQALA